MIKLYNILFEADEEHEPYTVWITDREFYGAKNSFNQIRYFEKEADARAFAAGEIRGPTIGRPEPKQHKQHEEPVQKYAK